MSVNLGKYKRNAREAVKAFWGNREAAKQKQISAGKLDQGERGSVTAGKNMNGFLVLVADVVKANGLTDAEVLLKGRVPTLPGYFRPTKIWDILVIRRKRLVAAIEFKSQIGSFGKNFNNRSEESIGAACDFWKAFREGAFGKQPRPFLGWLMLLEDGQGSRKPRQNYSPHFPVFPEFCNSSYADRYKSLCEKLVQEHLYTAAAILLTPRMARKDGRYTELSELTGLKTFVTTLAGHIAAEAAR